jgi:hypothetical protein
MIPNDPRRQAAFTYVALGSMVGSARYVSRVHTDPTSYSGDLRSPLAEWRLHPWYIGAGDFPFASR